MTSVCHLGSKRSVAEQEEKELRQEAVVEAEEDATAPSCLDEPKDE